MASEDGAGLTAPPVADREDTHEDRHGTPSHRPYAWMKDRDDPRLLPLLEAENAWTRAQLTSLDPLAEAVYEEIVAHVQQSDASAPVPRGPWAYFVRTVEGLEQRLHCRIARGGVPGDDSEHVLLDENVLAEPTGYCSLGGMAVSPDHRLLAYSLDVEGAERHTLRVRDLDTGDHLDDEIGPADGRPVAGAVVWSADGRHLLYTVQDDAHRSYQLWLHRLGAPVEEDELLLEEPDERYWLWLRRELSGRYAIVSVASSVTSEARLLDLTDPTARPVLIAEREQGLLYSPVHRGDELWVLHNADGATDFAVSRVALEDVVAGRGRAAWREVVPHRPGTRLMDVEAFATHVALEERVDGLPRVRTYWPDEDRFAEVAFDGAVVVSIGAHAEFDTDTLRVTVDSMITPRETWDVALATGERTLVKRTEVPGHDPAAYRTARVWATAPDGARVPITIAHRADVEPDGSNPCHVYGYGAYEVTIDPAYTPMLSPWLDRGVVYAIVHPRGGGALGRRWYEDGKFAQKPNTFTDTLACADHLVEAGWAHPDRLSLEGASAGGLLVGATLNLRPERFVAALAEVPFVDVRATMWDASIPLTVLEYDEWGDPSSDPDVDAVIAGYTPTENIVDEPYPALLVTSGINDPRVGYWEPTLWVQEHRHVRSDDRPVLLRTELGAGHFGPSGRYGRWRKDAESMAFLLHHLGAAQLLPSLRTVSS